MPEMQKVKVAIRPPHGWVAKFKLPGRELDKELYFFPEFEVTIEVPAGLDDDEFGTAVVNAIEEIVKTGTLPGE